MGPLRVARGAVGLDVGTSAVRAAEVRPGRTPVVTRFGQVLLPSGAVADGVVEDPAAVAAAVATLWKRASFRSRVVRLGVSNSDVVVRQIELPAMPREEIEGAIQYEGREYIPIPLEEAVVDFEVMEETVGEEGQALQRVMVVAAQRAMVDRLLDGVHRARLQTEVLELNAYPLVRSLGAHTTVPTEAEAIVDVGAGGTDVVVHHGGRIRFFRVLRSGGDDFTRAVADALELPWHDAEALKHRTGLALADRLGVGEVAFEEEREEDVERAADVLAPHVRTFADEIRGSLDYYDTQPDALPLGRLVLTGGGSLLGGLRERIAQSVHLEVAPGRPFSRVRVGRVRLSEEQVVAAEPFLAVAVGLALGALED